jgi:hypothetical protein
MNDFIYDNNLTLEWEDYEAWKNQANNSYRDLEDALDVAKQLKEAYIAEHGLNPVNRSDYHKIREWALLTDEADPQTIIEDFTERAMKHGFELAQQRIALGFQKIIEQIRLSEQ